MHGHRTMTRVFFLHRPRLPQISQSLAEVPVAERKRLTQGIASSSDLGVTAIDELHAFLEEHPAEEEESLGNSESRTMSAVEELAEYLRSH